MKSKSSISSRSGVVRRRIVDGQDSCKMVDNTPMSRRYRKCDQNENKFSVSYFGICSMYIKVSGIFVGASVGVFVGITTSQRVECTTSILWDGHGVVLTLLRTT